MNIGSILTDLTGQVVNTAKAVIDEAQTVVLSDPHLIADFIKINVPESEKFPLTLDALVQFEQSRNKKDLLLVVTKFLSESLGAVSEKLQPKEVVA